MQRIVTFCRSIPDLYSNFIREGVGKHGYFIKYFLSPTLQIHHVQVVSPSAITGTRVLLHMADDVGITPLLYSLN